VPLTFSIQRDTSNAYLVALGSDGHWDVMENEALLNLLPPLSPEPSNHRLDSIANEIVLHSMQTLGSDDNISLALVYLPPETLIENLTARFNSLASSFTR